MRNKYLIGQSAWLVNYAKRHRAELRVGTAITEGTANFLVNRRMNKSQQMRRSRRGADLLLQVRCAVYNGTLGSEFGQKSASQRLIPDNRRCRLTPGFAPVPLKLTYHVDLFDLFQRRSAARKLANSSLPCADHDPREIKRVRKLCASNDCIYPPCCQDRPIATVPTQAGATRLRSRQRHPGALADESALLLCHRRVDPHRRSPDTPRECFRIALMIRILTHADFVDLL